MLQFTMEDVRISNAEVKRIVNDPRSPVIQEFKQIGRRIVTAARAQVGKGTGELALSITYDIRRFRGNPELSVGSDNKIAYLHHEGTRPHAIRARNQQFLRFSSRGRIVYARTVIHPGTKPNRFLTDNVYLARL